MQRVADLDPLHAAIGAIGETDAHARVTEVAGVTPAPATVDA